MYDLIIRRAKLVDGTLADVAVQAGKIVVVGQLDRLARTLLPLFADLP
jgi:dihydroorotase